MRSRAEQSRNFESSNSNLFEAGISVVKAAKAHKEIVNTLLETIANAMELNIGEMSSLNQVVDGSQVNLIYEALSLQRQEAETKGNFEAYVSAEEKLQQLEEFEAQRLERQARMLEAQVRIQSAQKQLKEAP